MHTTRINYMIHNNYIINIFSLPIPIQFQLIPTLQISFSDSYFKAYGESDKYITESLKSLYFLPIENLIFVRELAKMYVWRLMEITLNFKVYLKVNFVEMNIYFHCKRLRIDLFTGFLLLIKIFHLSLFFNTIL